jgi:IclR family transcriptional regulator, pca regulon regulatory protein
MRTGPDPSCDVIAEPADKPAEKPKPGDTYVQSFARGLAVIRSFSASAPAQSLTEVAASTGLTRAGARRILLTLEGLGYVQSQGRQFRLTPKILDLGFAYLSSLPLWDLAEPVMEELVAELKESCSASVLDHDEVVYVLRVSTHKIMSINLGIGSRLPAFCTSMGRVLLGALPLPQLTALLAAKPLEKFNQHTITDPAALEAVVAQVREQGWSLVDRELEEDLVSLAAPVRDRSGRTIAALNISGQYHRTPPAKMVEQVLPRLLAASNRISRLLQMKS